MARMLCCLCLLLSLPAIALPSGDVRRDEIANRVRLGSFVVAECARGVCLLQDLGGDDLTAVWERPMARALAVGGSTALFKVLGHDRDTLTAADLGDPIHPAFSDLLDRPEIGGISAVEVSGVLHVAFSAVDGGHESIYYMRRERGEWREPRLLSASGCDQPRTMPAIAVTAGRIIVAFAGYDGSDYEVYTVTGDGQLFSAESLVTSNEVAADIFPVFRSTNGAGAELAWTRYGVGESREIIAPVGADGSVREVAETPSVAEPSRTAESLANVFCGFGDSITEGNGSDGYYPALETLLGQNYGASDVINAGFPGEITAGGLARLPSVLASRRPGTVLLMEGTNDVTRNQSSRTIADNMLQMVLRCREAGSVPVLSTLIPRGPNDGFDPNNTATGRANQLLRVSMIQNRIPYVDMFDAFLADPDYRDNLMEDHVHPNGRGYDVMGRQWYEGIARLGPRTPSSVTASQVGNKKQVLVSWPANADSDANGYLVHYGTSPGIYDKVVDAANRTSYRIDNLEYGVTYYFAARCYDRKTNLSGLSPEASVTVSK
ncbi:MAG: hypothetical protein HYX75_03545 [Acidobacteria bacterium]|nr:hypothetical protein [Acidobacteriota bacterium]